MIGDAAVSAAPDVARAERLFSRSFTCVPSAIAVRLVAQFLGRLQLGVLVNDIGHRGLEFPGVDMLRVAGGSVCGVTRSGRGAPSGRDRGSSRNRTR